MAKGEITFYFDTLADLQAQLLETLGMGALSDTRFADRPAAFRYPDPVTPEPVRGVLGCLGADMTAHPSTIHPTKEQLDTAITRLHTAPIEPTKAQVEEAGKIISETTQAIRTASGIDAEVRKANQEAAAEQVEQDKATAAEVVPILMAGLAAAEVVHPQATASAGPVEETLTVETLGTVEYPELLAFCERNPGVGVDASKAQAKFFRQMVEFKIKAFLESK